MHRLLDQDTRIDYAVSAQVGGKLAQIGSRLVDAASKKMADDFFTKFNAELARRNPDAVAAAAPPAAAQSHDAAPAAGGASAAYAGDISFGGLIGIFVGLCVAVTAIAFLLSKL